MMKTPSDDRLAHPQGAVRPSSLCGLPVCQQRGRPGPRRTGFGADPPRRWLMSETQERQASIWWTPTPRCHSFTRHGQKKMGKSLDSPVSGACFGHINNAWPTLTPQMLPWVLAHVVWRRSSSAAVDELPDRPFLPSVYLTPIPILRIPT
ncbi:hypothetical protein BCR34DRAFT_577265 [Clohesyomyces aquaticus]|uniref:Uncharacterized protein n=1 Tax=Clohesyomyces aquaticus TaxID=1231657 RepID=A0A1Y1YKC5_9PLEO|nr:hypothetical protein BCR34DRAFT_577265 [Clohesyomyces aquaticus]